jgi:hypothetical protein
MFKSEENKGNKKYTLNFFSFCGFGFVNHSNEAIFLVPTKHPENDDLWEME